MSVSTAPTTGEIRSHPIIVGLCMIITVIEGYNLIVYGAVGPYLLADRRLGIDEGGMGAIGGMVYIGSVLGALTAAACSARFGRKQILMAAVGLFGAGALLAALATNGDMLGAARFVSGIGIGGALTTAMTLARNHAAQRRAALVVTVTMAGIPLGGVVASLLAMPVLPAVGWRPMFGLGALLALLILAAIAVTPISSTTPQDLAAEDWSTRDRFAAVFTGRAALITLVVAGCTVTNMVAWQGLNVWITEAMHRSGFSVQVALAFAFTLTGAAVLGSFATAWAADRYGAALTSIGSGSCTVLGLVGMLALPAHTVVTVACVGLMGIGGHSTMNLIHTTTADIYPLQARSTALGWSNGTSFVGAFLGPTLGGMAIAGHGPHGVWLTFGISAGICLALVSVLYLLDRLGARFRVPQHDASVLATTTTV